MSICSCQHPRVSNCRERSWPETSMALSCEKWYGPASSIFGLFGVGACCVFNACPTSVRNFLCIVGFGGHSRRFPASIFPNLFAMKEGGQFICSLVSFLIVFACACVTLLNLMLIVQNTNATSHTCRAPAANASSSSTSNARLKVIPTLMDANFKCY